MLALTRNHRQTRTWLQDKLWGDRAPAQGAASLRQSLTTLRCILNRDGDVLHADRTWVWLDASKISLDHTSGESQGELLRGFDLREEGFNDWLRENRASMEARAVRWGAIDVPTQPDRRWHLDRSDCRPGDEDLLEVSDLVCDSLAEALSVVGIHSAVDRRTKTQTEAPRATDRLARVRVSRFGSGCVVSLTVTDGIGTLCWQVRREADAARWSELRGLQIEIAQLFQDFAIRTEAASQRGDRWSAHANGCQALMGMLVPGSMPLKEIAQCSEAAIAADEQGIYHALLGYSQLLIYGEREKLGSLDADTVMQSIRTALRLAPGNGLVQALGGHSYGFVVRELDRNAEMTREGVRLLPGSGICWIYYAISLVYCGRYAEATIAAEKAVWLCRGSLAQPMALMAEHFAKLMSGDYVGSIYSGEKSLDASMFRPTVMNLMSAYALSGQVERSREKLEILIERDPDLCIDMLRSPDYPIVTVPQREITVQAAKVLGLR